MEMEKQMLMKSLEDAKDELTKEKQLLKEYIQSVDAQVKGLRHEIEESNHTNENRYIRGSCYDQEPMKKNIIYIFFMGSCYVATLTHSSTICID